MDDFLREFIAGGVGGVCFTLVLHPYDTVKVLTQTNKERMGSVKCFRAILKNEGFRGFYRGIASPLVGVTPMFAFCFLGYNIGNKLQTPSLPNNQYSRSQIFFSGMVAGGFSSFILGPFERIKCLVQAQPFVVKPEVTLAGGTVSVATEKKYNGTIDCLNKIYKEGGVRSVYKGTLLTFMRDVPSTGFYFLGYVEAKKMLNVKEGEFDAMAKVKIMAAGGLAGIANWVVAYPTDVVKSKYQTAHKDEYKNVLHVYRRVFETSGLTSFYKGFGTFAVGCFMAEAACFLGYEMAK